MDKSLNLLGFDFLSSKKDLEFKISLFFNFIFIVDTITDVLIFSLFVHLHPALHLLPSGHHHTVVYVYRLWIYVLWLNKVKRGTYIITSVLCFTNKKRPERSINKYNIFLTVWYKKKFRSFIFCLITLPTHFGRW